MSDCFYFKRVCFLVLCVCVCLCVVGGFINCMKQILKTLMLILFDETSLTAIRTPQPFKHLVTRLELV